LLHIFTLKASFYTPILPSSKILCWLEATGFACDRLWKTLGKLWKTLENFGETVGNRRKKPQRMIRIANFFWLPPQWQIVTLATEIVAATW
jgi:hypothetical protein